MYSKWKCCKKRKLFNGENIFSFECSWWGDTMGESRLCGIAELSLILDFPKVFRVKFISIKLYSSRNNFPAAKLSNVIYRGAPASRKFHSLKLSYVILFYRFFLCCSLYAFLRLRHTGSVRLKLYNQPGAPQDTFSPPLSCLLKSS